MEPGSAAWIVKPSITNQGAGIAVIDSCAGLRSVLEGGFGTNPVLCSVQTPHDRDTLPRCCQSNLGLRFKD